MGGFAWVTLATNDSYSLGALVLAHSLRQVGTAHQLAVLVTPGVTSVMREKLASVFNVIKEVNILDSRDEANLRLLQRPELGITFTKLHCWRLTQYDKCVFLDADTMVLANADELFEREEFSAAPDVGWPDCFNSGVFVYRPSEETYSKLVQFALEKGSFDGGDQGLLNLYFSDWAYKDISKHLPFIYNMCSTACYSYLPAFKQFGGNVKIIHFIGNSKPWLQYFDTETRQVHVTPDLQHLQGVVQRWWDVFCSLIHSTLSPQMAPNRAPAAYYLSFHSDYQHYHNPQHFNPYSENTYTDNTDGQEIQSDYRNVWDPWDDYEKQASQVCDNQEHNTEQVQCSTNCENNTSSEPFMQNQGSTESFLSDKPNTDSTSSNKENDFESHSYNNNHCSNESTKFETNSFTIPEPIHTHHSEPSIQPPCPEQSCSSNETTVPIPESNQPAWPLECAPASSVTNESALHGNPSEVPDSNGGLAGAFARLTLGVPRTAEQSSLEDHLRRQGWEVGNIDYMGRDSFDNIWSKICETLASPPQPEAAATPVPEPVAPPPAKPEPTPAAEPTPVPAKPQVPEPVAPTKPVEAPAPAAAEVVPPAAAEVVPPAEIHTPLAAEVPKSPLPSEPPKPVAPPSESAAPPSEPPKPAAPPSEPPKPAAPPIELPKPVAPPSEPPKPVAPSSEPPKPAAPPTESPKPVAPPSEPLKPVAPPSEPLKPAAPLSEPPKSAAPPSEPPKPAAPLSEPPKPATPSSGPPKPVALPSEPPKPAGSPSEPPKPVAPPSEPPKPAAPPSEPPKPAAPKQEPKPTTPQTPPPTQQAKPKAPAAKPEPEAAPKAPASGKQAKAAPAKPETEKAEAAAAPPKSTKTPPTSPLPGSQPKAEPAKEPTSPTPEATEAAGAQGPTPPPRKTGGGGSGSKKSGKGKK